MILKLNAHITFIPAYVVSLGAFLAIHLATMVFILLLQSRSAQHRRIVQKGFPVRCAALLLCQQLALV